MQSFVVLIVVHPRCRGGGGPLLVKFQHYLAFWVAIQSFVQSTVANFELHENPPVFTSGFPLKGDTKTSRQLPSALARSAQRALRALRLATVAMFYGSLRPGPPLPRNILEARSLGRGVKVCGTKRRGRAVGRAESPKSVWLFPKELVVGLTFVVHRCVLAICLGSTLEYLKVSQPRGAVIFRGFSRKRVWMREAASRIWKEY